jgi:two-component system NtrC family sensor kinase
MTRFGAELRKLGDGAASMEEVAGHTVRALYERFGGSGDRRSCALVRTFVTMPYADLQSDLQLFAERLFPGIVHQPATKCLTLLATAGDEPEWNTRHASHGHQALPLASEESISRSPMISQLIQQLGVEVGELLGPRSDVVLETGQHTFNVFHVANALGSPHIPAQAEFVQPYGIRSVIGFGGLLPPGELFATIMFARVAIPRESADLFKTLALNVKVALLPFAALRVFS